MGGSSGEFYGRSTVDGHKRNERGYSEAAAELDKRKQADAGLLFTRDRLLHCDAVSPVVLAFDATGSMDTLPKIIYDKMPLVAGQLAKRQYVENPEISLAVIGDIVIDRAPIQVADFTKPIHLDPQLKRLYLEKGGGSNDACESYEFMLYAYGERSRFTRDATPFFIITGDEGFRPELKASDINRHFGESRRRSIDTEEVFAQAKRRFNDNVFLLRRPYGNLARDREIQKQWEQALGADYIIPLEQDVAVADLLLGIIAVRGGASSLASYLNDMETARDKPQTRERIRLVERALTPLAKLGPTKRREHIDPSLHPEDQL